MIRYLLRTSACMLMLCAPAAAQERTARDVLSFLVTTQAVQTGDFERDREAAEATRDTIASALLIEMATLPLATSSGAFSYRFNPEIGTVERVAQSFGPLFVNRAVTSGRGQFTASLGFRQSQFVSLSGRNLRDGALITTANQFRDEPTPFDIEALELELQARTATFSANFGVLDFLDIGVAVPVVQLSMSGERVNTYRGTTFLQARGTATSSGIGDVALRTKLQFFRQEGAAIAADVEVRLPTGDVENLRGAGEAALRSALVASIGTGAVEGHASVGFVAGGLSNELAVSGAVSTAITQRVTFSAEAIVRTIGELRRMREVVEPHPLIGGVDTLRLLPEGESTTTVLSVIGARWNFSETWLLNAYVLVPVTDTGLRARVTPAISLEYSVVP